MHDAVWWTPVLASSWTAVSSRRAAVAATTSSAYPSGRRPTPRECVAAAARQFRLGLAASRPRGHPCLPWLSAVAYCSLLGWIRERCRSRRWLAFDSSTLVGPRQITAVACSGPATNDGLCPGRIHCGRAVILSSGHDPSSAHQRRARRPRPRSCATPARTRTRSSTASRQGVLRLDRRRSGDFPGLTEKLEYIADLGATPSGPTFYLASARRRLLHRAHRVIRLGR